MASDIFSGPQDDDDTSEELEEALEEFVWTYRRRSAETVSEFLDDRLDHGGERVALEMKTLQIFEPASDEIAAALRDTLAPGEASSES